MSETRLGKQTPTISGVLPYTESHGSEAIAIYNRSGRTAQLWQALITGSNVRNLFPVADK